MKWKISYFFKKEGKKSLNISIFNTYSLSTLVLTGNTHLCVLLLLAPAVTVSSTSSKIMLSLSVMQTCVESTDTAWSPWNIIPMDLSSLKEKTMGFHIISNNFFLLHEQCWWIYWKVQILIWLPQHVVCWSNVYHCQLLDVLQIHITTMFTFLC